MSNGFIRPVRRTKNTNTNEFKIRGVGYTTREYCESKGIVDKDQIKKIQWRINKYIHTHTKEEATTELIRLVSFAPVSRISPISRLDHQRQEKNNETLGNTSDGVRPWQGTKKERIIAEQEKSKLLKQSEWMNVRPSNTTPINVPDAKDGIQITIYDNISSLPQANGKWPDKRLRENHHPTSTSTPPIIKETNITDAPERLREAYRSLKLYADAIEKKKTIQYKIDTLEAELKDAQKEVEKWSTTAAALLRDV